MLVTLLIVLLGALGSLQYVWLSEISLAERERLKARLQTDAQRFSGDFNGEITRTFYTFEIDSQILLPENSQLFAERYDLWRAQTNFPGMIKAVFLISNKAAKLNNDENLNQFNPSSKQFEKADWTDETSALRDKLRSTEWQNEAEMVAPEKSSPQIIDEDIPALIIPVQQSLPGKPATFTSRSVPGKNAFVVNLSKSITPPHQFIIVELDQNVIKNEMLPEIFRRNFAEESSDYNFSVVNRASPERIIFQSNGARLETGQPDISTEIFNISPESANILVLSGDLPRVRFPEKHTVIFHQSIERRQSDNLPGVSSRAAESGLPGAANSNSVQVRVTGSKVENGRLETKKVDEDNGRWILNVQHTDGSLENFVGKTKWRNLGLSFGILAMLGSSVLMLIFSTHKLRGAARKQMDFVSSVSHEFRTPVAVICSAGDNLADGIVTNRANIERYGRLIRREGNRLTEMVEQILDFAGAQSGRKKYSFQKFEVAYLISNAVADCQSLLDEKGLVVETNLAPNLPEISVDHKSLCLVLQNLINNAVKYSNGSRKIEIDARQSAGGVMLTVTDHGIGIEAGELKHIFEPFFRGQRVIDAQIHGNGLGLSLVKQIIDAHKGRISVESKPQIGSKFTIQLPI